MSEQKGEGKGKNTSQKEKNKAIGNKGLNEKKVSKKAFLIYAAIALVSIASIAGALFYVSYTKGYAMIFEGKKIKMPDYEFYHILQGAGEKSAEIREAALAGLTDFLIMEQEAKARGFTLTQEEKDAVALDVPKLKSNITSYNLMLPKISDERIGEIISGNFYYQKLLDEVTKDYVVDEADFKVQLDDYRENGKQLYVDSQLKYVMTDTQEKAEEARAKALAGTPFDDVIKEFSGDYSEESEVQTLNLNEITLPEDAVTEILESQPTHITNVYPVEDIFAFFEVQTLNFPTDEELEANARELYITGKRSELFNAEFDKWKEAADYTINQQALDDYDKK